MHSYKSPPKRRTTKMLSKLNRRSPRLMEKEACQKISQAFKGTSIPLEWVFDDALFNKCWEYEQLVKRQEYALAHCMGCSECERDAEEEREQMKKDLPGRYYPKKEVQEVLQTLITLTYACKRPEMQMMYATAMMRFIHGPARYILRDPHIREEVKEDCNWLPQSIYEIGLINTEFGQRMADACWAVAQLIDECEDEDGYNIFTS